MDDANHVSTPCESGTKFMLDMKTSLVYATLYTQLVGSLNYLTLARPDIAYNVGLVSIFMSKPQWNHFKVAKRILRYIKPSINVDLFYDANFDFILKGFTNLDLGAYPNDGKPTYGYFQMQFLE